MSRGAYIFSLRRVAWTITTIVCSIAVNTMTTSWTTLLTPTQITVVVKSTGIAMSTSSIHDIIDALLHSANLTAASGQGIFDFNRASYSISTGGILATGPSANDPGPDTAISFDMPVRLGFSSTSRYPRPSGLPMSYSVTQQGFTADVSCSQQVIPGNSLYTFNRYLGVTLDTVSDKNETLYGRDWTLRCLNGGLAVHISAEPGGVLTALGCVDNLSNDGSLNHSITFIGRGPSYGFINTTMCSITPKVITVTASYGNTIDISHYNLTRSDSGYAGRLAVSGMTTAFLLSQTPRQNFLAESITAISLTRGELRTEGTSEDLTRFNSALEDYLRGGIEYVGTVDIFGYP